MKVRLFFSPLSYRLCFDKFIRSGNAACHAKRCVRLAGFEYSFHQLIIPEGRFHENLGLVSHLRISFELLYGFLALYFINW